jgi:hypothetical protein
LKRRINRVQKRRGHGSIMALRDQADEVVHVATNLLVEVTWRHAARIVIEELTMQRRLKARPVGRKGGRGCRNFRHILGCQQYANLVRVLTYKLPRAGLLLPIEIDADFTPQTASSASMSGRKIGRSGRSKAPTCSTSLASSVLGALTQPTPTGTLAA